MTKHNEGGEHTPGPWRVMGYGIVKGSRRCLIAHVYMQSGQGVDFGDAKTNANARLIAAAPELLEACNQAIFAIPTTHGAFEVVRSAIAKATGGSHE